MRYPEDIIGELGQLPSSLAESYDVVYKIISDCLNMVAEALSKLAPASLHMGEGRTTFAVNRRNNREADVPALLAKGEPLKGPNGGPLEREDVAPRVAGHDERPRPRAEGHDQPLGRERGVLVVVH